MSRRRTLSGLFALCLLLLAAPGHGRELTGEVRWSGQVSLKETTVVAAGATLKVAPGTRVVAGPDVKLVVQGTLLVEGSAEAPVSFSGPKGWAGVEFMEAPAGSLLRWATFAGAQAAVSSFATDFRVEQCTFTGGEFGIRLLRESHPQIVDSTFDGNLVGLANEMKSGAVVSGSRFRGNGRAGILASHNSRGEIGGSSFTGGKAGIVLLQDYPDRIAGNRFVDNEVAIQCNQTKSTPLIEGNHFEKNGIGVMNISFAYPVIRNNRFLDNKSALHNDQYGSPVVEHNLFRGNETALHNNRKSNPQVRLNRFEKNGLLMFCDFSSYPQVRDNDLLGNRSGVKLGIYQSADWERRSGSKAIMQREAASRESKNPLLARAPEKFEDFVDVGGNWWGDDTAQLARAGKDGNSELFYDRHDKPEVSYPDFGPGVYRLDLVRFAPWLTGPVKGAGPLAGQ